MRDPGILRECARGTGGLEGSGYIEGLRSQWAEASTHYCPHCFVGKWSAGRVNVLPL
jgi:hypothetical protein